MTCSLVTAMQKYNTNATLVCAIEHLYDENVSAVQMNCNTGEFIQKWLITTVGVRKGCLLTLSPFNIFWRIVSDALEDHDGKVGIGNGTIIGVFPASLMLFPRRSR